MNKLSDIAYLSRGPIYKEVKRRITDALAAGEWKPGEAIPAEPRLAQRYGISIGTLRKAIDELVAENALVRQQGRGTFVASHGREGMRFLFFNIVRHDGVREYPDVRLQRFRRERAADEVAPRLLVAPRAPVIAFRNTLWLGGAPIGVDDITVPAQLFEGLTQRRLQQRDNTIYHLYEHGFGVSVVRTAETVRAQAAPHDVAELLRLPAGAPVLQVRRIAYTLHERPVEYRVSWVNTAEHEYQREP
ncbi:MAG TPA: GntR family transcriptional regulator [Burkholderiaceae bacterium]|nr:GntR family transcriptional regulator [Burkholderiaceae bacterium]